jgi:hypothetical protein
MWKHVLTPLIVAVSLCACGTDTKNKACSLDARPGLELTIVAGGFTPDSGPGKVTVSRSYDGEQSSDECTLREDDASGVWSCTVAFFENTGRNDLTISLTGYETAVRSVDVGGDRCHSDETPLTVELQRAA